MDSYYILANKIMNQIKRDLASNSSRVYLVT